MELNWATVAYLVCGVGFIVSVIGLFYHSRRDRFDEWYSVQRKLEDEEERKKKQTKSGGKKKEKKSNTQAKQQKEESVKGEKKTSVVEKNEDAVKEDVEGKGTKKNKKSNSVSESDAPKQSPQNAKPSEKKADPVQRDRSPLKAKNADPEFVEVKNKQQKKRESEKASPEPVKTAATVVEVVRKIETAPLMAAPEKPKRRLEEMDVGKLLADMVSSMDTVHVQFLKNYVETVNKKEKASLAVVSTTNTEKNDLLRQLTGYSQKIRSLEEALTQLQAQNGGLNEKIYHLVQKETFLNGELDKKTKEMVAFRSSADDILKVAEKSKHAVADLQKRLEDARTEVKTHSSRVAELETELDKAKKTVQPEADTGALKTTHSQEISALKKKHAAEITSISQKHTAEKKELQEKLAEAMEQYLSIQELCNKLQNEVQNFEKMQAELNQKEDEVAKQKKTLAEINAAHNELLNENLALRQQIDALNKKMKTSPVQNGDLGEEIIVKKSHELTSAPPSSAAGDSNLREENQRLKNKNEELRVRNFKLQEMFDNHTAAPTSSKPVETKPEPVQTKKKDNKKSKKEDNKPNDASTQHSASTAEPPIVKTYRDALLTLRSELDRMKDMHDEQQNHIQQLEAQVKNKNAPQKTKSTPSAVASEVPSKPVPKKATSSTGSGEENDWELVN